MIYKVAAGWTMQHAYRSVGIVILLDALLYSVQRLVTCADQDRSELIWMPRYFTLLTSTKGELLTKIGGG